MKLSTKGRYGLRAMIELAREFEGGPVFMGDIAKRQDLSRKYLHALLTSLKSSGLVKSVRGAQGGYMLAREPSEIKVSDVFEALEGKLSIIDCVYHGDSCDRALDCETRDMWREVNEAMISVLDGVTLADLVDRNKNPRKSDEKCKPREHSGKSAKRKKDT